MNTILLEQFKNKKFVYEFFNTTPTIKCLADRLTNFTNYPIKIKPQDLVMNLINPDIPVMLYEETENSIKPHYVSISDEKKYRGPNIYDLLRNLLEVYPSIEFKEYKSGVPPYSDEKYLILSENSIMDAGDNPEELIQDSVNFLATGIYDHMDCQLLNQLQNITSKQNHVIAKTKSFLTGANLDQIFKSFKTKIIIAPQEYQDLFLYHEYNVFPVKNDLIGNKIYFIPQIDGTKFLLNMELGNLEYFIKQNLNNIACRARSIRAFVFNSKIDYYQLNIKG